MAFLLGSFLGGMAQGAQQGMQLGTQLRGVIDNANVRKATTDAMQQAQAARENAISSLIQKGGISGQAGAVQPPAATTGDDSPFLTSQQTDQIAQQAQQQAATGDDSPFLTSQQSSQIAGSQPASQAPANTGNVGAAIKEPGAVSPAQAQAMGLPPLPGKPADATASSPTGAPLPTDGKGNVDTTASPTGVTAAATQAAKTGDPATDIANATAAATTAQAAPAVAGQTPAGQTVYTVNGQTYNNLADAHAAAEKYAPSIMEEFLKNGAPMIEQTYLQQGDPAKAAAWRQYVDSEQSRIHMGQWAKIYTAAALGDQDKAADETFNFLKQNDMGITPLSKQTIKDKDGNITGFNVTYKDNTTGKTVSQTMTPDNLLQLGMTALAPPKMFEQMYQSNMLGKKYQYELALEGMKDERMMKTALAAAAIRGNATIQAGEARANGYIGAAREHANAPSPFQKSYAYLQSLGYQPSEINSILGHSGNSGVGKTPAPATMALHVSTALSRDTMTRYPSSQLLPNGQPKMMAFNQLPLSDQKKIVNDHVAMLLGTNSGSQAPAASSPAASGLPAVWGTQDLYQSLTHPAAGGVPVLNRDGSISYQ